MPTNYGTPGATNPKDLYVAGRTSVPSAGGYQGYNITPGTDADIASQVQAINAMMKGPTASSPTTTSTASAGAPTSVTTTTAGKGSTDINSAYDKAMSKYLEALTASNEIDSQAEKAALESRHAIEDIYDKSGGLKSGASESAAYFTRRANANLADLGVAQDAATRATTASFERAKYEKDQLGKAPEDFNLSPGQERYSYDPATGGYTKIASVASNEPTGPASVQEYEYAKRNGYIGSFTQYQNEDANRKARAAGSTATERAAAQRADINAAINDFRTQMRVRQWAGANPDAYQRYKEYLMQEYGLSAVNELENAMQSFGIVVDTKNK